MLAVIFLFLITLIFDWKIGIQQSLSKWKNKRLWMAGGICGCALFVAASLQQIGLVYTDPGKAGFLTAMYIVLVPMLGIFVHRRPGLNAVISVVLALVGLYLLSFMGVTSINVGDLFLIGGALGFAVQILLMPLGFAGLLSMGVAYSLQIVGQKNLEPTTASLIMSLESVFAALGGWLILHNTMTPRELCGCGLVFAGVIISQLPTKKQTV